MTIAKTITEIEEELYLCEKLAMVVSETGVSNEQIDDENVAKHFRAIGEVSLHLSRKLESARCRLEDVERMTRPDTVKSSRATADQDARKRAFSAVQDIEPAVATLEAQMILLDMAIETMMGSRSTETAGAGLSNLQGSMNASIAEINRTWKEAHEATQALSEGVQAEKGEDHD